jgi:hypothetical protein
MPPPPDVENGPSMAKSCGTTTVLYARDAYTIGHRGHPGAEITTFHVCAECLS